jgi:hypothetical protein
VPYVVLGVEIGPLELAVNRAWVRHSLRGAIRVVARNPESRQQALDLGVAPDRVRLAPSS